VEWLVEAKAQGGQSQKEKTKKCRKERRGKERKGIK